MYIHSCACPQTQICNFVSYIIVMCNNDKTHFFVM